MMATGILNLDKMSVSSDWMKMFPPTYLNRRRNLKIICVTSSVFQPTCIDCLTNEETASLFWCIFPLIWVTWVVSLGCLTCVVTPGFLTWVVSPGLSQLVVSPGLSHLCCLTWVVSPGCPGWTVIKSSLLLFCFLFSTTTVLVCAVERLLREFYWVTAFICIIVYVFLANCRRYKRSELCSAKATTT